MKLELVMPHISSTPSALRANVRASEPSASAASGNGEGFAASVAAAEAVRTVVMRVRDSLPALVSIALEPYPHWENFAPPTPRPTRSYGPDTLVPGPLDRALATVPFVGIAATLGWGASADGLNSLLLLSVGALACIADGVQGFKVTKAIANGTAELVREVRYTMAQRAKAADVERQRKSPAMAERTREAKIRHSEKLSEWNERERARSNAVYERRGSITAEHLKPMLAVIEGLSGEPRLAAIAMACSELREVFPVTTDYSFEAQVQLRAWRLVVQGADWKARATAERAVSEARG